MMKKNQIRICNSEFMDPDPGQEADLLHIYHIRIRNTAKYICQTNAIFPIRDAHNILRKDEQIEKV
jgi:hypothetical protein